MKQRKQLRPYQKQVLDALAAEIDKGNSRVVIAAPCGAGKTVKIVDLIADAMEQGLRCAVVVHMTALLDQTRDKLVSDGVEDSDISYLCGGGKYDPQRPIQLCSAQAMARRSGWKYLPERDTVDVWFLDECHEVAFTKPGTWICCESNAPLVIGLTATPYRMSKREGLTERFDAIVSTPPPRELIEMGFLVPTRGFVMAKPGDAPDLSNVKTVAGDFSSSDLAVACDQPALVAHLIDNYIEKAAGKRALAFAVNVAHATSIHEEALRRSIPSRLVTGATPQAERHAVYEAFKKGEVHLISSVDVISIGFDAVEAEVALVARPTKSKSKHFQIVGRVGRISPHTGKTEALIIDQAGNLLRFGPPEAIDGYTLDAPTADEKGEAKYKACPECGHLELNFARECSQCGYEWPAPKKVMEGREMVEYRVRGVTIDLEQKRMERLSTYLRQAYDRNFAPQWALYRFKEQYGQWPTATQRLHAVFPQPTRQDAADYLLYLCGIASSKDKDRSWVSKEFLTEFGTTYAMADIAARNPLIADCEVLKPPTGVLAALRSC